MNTNSNSYTIGYAAIMVIVVAFLLAFLSNVLQDPIASNERMAKQRSILAALNIRDIKDVKAIEAKYNEVLKKDAIVDKDGNTVKEEGGFNTQMKEISENNLPVFVCEVDGKTKYVVPLKGKGLWGGVYVYLALNEDGRTIYGSYFLHDSETAGLGALITEERFQKQFIDKKFFTIEGDKHVTVVKKGKVEDAEYDVDGISGATLTGDGIAALLRDGAANYKAYFTSNTQK